MRKISSKTKLYKYLNENGYMDGDLELLETGKKEYRKSYKIQHQKNKRKTQKSVRIWYEKADYLEVKKQAETHTVSLRKIEPAENQPGVDRHQEDIIENKEMKSNRFDARNLAPGAVYYWKLVKGDKESPTVWFETSRAALRYR